MKPFPSRFSGCLPAMNPEAGLTALTPDRGRSPSRSKPRSTVAAIIPLYNKAQYLPRALNSILAQTHLPTEIIVVDDGSTDDSISVLQIWMAEHFDRLREAEIDLQLLQQTNTGPGAARNRGGQTSSASLLAFLDADDEWEPDFLAGAIAALETHPHCMLAAFGQFQGSDRTDLQPRFNALGIRPGPWRLPPDLPPPVMKPTIDFIFSGATVVRREVFETLGGFYAQAGCTYGEDTYFWLQVALQHEIYRDPTPMMWYHTECSDLAIWHRQVPLSPLLLHPQLLRDRCPVDYQVFLERYLAQVAIVTARRFAYRGDRDTVKALLRRFPLTRLFRADQAKINLELLLANFPQLRSWILNARFSA